MEDAEEVIRQEQEDTETAQNVGLRTAQPEKTFQEMMIAIGDSLSDFASSNDEDDGENEYDEEIEQGKRSKDDEPRWVMGKIFTTVQQGMERFPQKQMKLGKLTQLGWGDTAVYFHDRDKKYGTCESRVPAVIKLQMEDDAVAPATTTVGELMECLDIVPGLLQMLEGTSVEGNIYITLGFRKPQSHTGIANLAPAAKPNSSPIQK